MSTDPMKGITGDASLAMAGQADVDQLKNLAEGGSENLEKVASKFESIFLGFLIKQMWESVGKSELFPQSAGREIYNGMLTTMLADHISQNGGIGIADSMVNQLKTAARAYEEQTESIKGKENNESKDIDLKDISTAPAIQGAPDLPEDH